MAAAKDPSAGCVSASGNAKPEEPGDPDPSEVDRELQRMQMLPWTRVITAVAGGGYHARVRELPRCTAGGATPSEALARLEELLMMRLREGARGEAALPSPNHWDRSAIEYVPVPLPRELFAQTQGIADDQGLSLGSYIEGTVRASLETDGAERRARTASQSHERADAPGSELDHGGAESGRLLDRILFPAATSPSNHWQRIVLNEAIADHLAALGPSNLTAAEISGGSHAHLPWKSYESLDFPEFDLCAPPAGQGPYDVVICEQVLEHVEDPRTAVTNLRKLTKPGGHVVVSTPFLIRVHELEQYGMHDFWRFTPRGLATLLEGAGLVVDEVGDWGNRWCVLGNLSHWSSYRRWHSLRREPDMPVQVWAFARRPAE